MRKLSLFFLLMFITPALYGSNTASQTAAGIVIHASGTSNLYYSNETKNMLVGTWLREGMKIKTGSNGNVIIMFENGNVVRVQPLQTVQLISGYNLKNLAATTRTSSVITSAPTTIKAMFSPLRRLIDTSKKTGFKLFDNISDKKFVFPQTELPVNVQLTSAAKTKLTSQLVAAKSQAVNKLLAPASGDINSWNFVSALVYMKFGQYKSAFQALSAMSATHRISSGSRQLAYLAYAMSGKNDIAKQYWQVVKYEPEF